MRKVDGLPLWLGNVGDIADLSKVLSFGIEAVVDLALNESPAKLTHELVYCRFPLLDGTGNSVWLIRIAVECLGSLMRSNVRTFVYCSAGMSRTLVVAAAVVAVLQDRSLTDGLSVVASGGPADVSPALLSEVQSVLEQNG